MELTVNEQIALTQAGIGPMYWKTLASQGPEGQQVLTWFRSDQPHNAGITMIGGGAASWELFHVLAAQMTLAAMRTGQPWGARVMSILKLGTWLTDLEDERDILDGVWFIPDFQEDNRAFPLRQWEAGLVIDAMRTRINAGRSMFIRADTSDMDWWPRSLIEQIGLLNVRLPCE